VQIVNELVPFVDRSILLLIIARILIADPVCLEMIDTVLPATRSGSHDAIEKTGHAEPSRDN
jgi:hypothetical protein